VRVQRIHQIAGVLMLMAGVAVSVSSGFAQATSTAPAQAQTQPPATQSPQPNLPQQNPASQKPAQPPRNTTSADAAPVGVQVPSDYVIGPDDVLSILFWRNQEISGDVAVRPDGLISLPVLNEVSAAGLTPEQLRAKLTEQASKYFEEPNVTVVVKAINSRKVYITGMVGKPGPYPLSGSLTVLQLIAMAGGLHEFADAKNISIIRTDKGRQIRIPFNYKDVLRGKNLKQNIELKPGDAVVVP
jgi:polysaccharide biosynthesis/export protein